MKRHLFGVSVVAALGLFIAMSLAVRVVAGSGQSDTGAPLVGANYAHYASSNCSVEDRGIVAHYHDRSVRRQVQAQLAAMRAAGIETLRLLLWHMTDTSGQHWGVVSSAGGRLAEPYRSNLIRYVRDVRAAGFSRLTVSFGPMWTNSPFGQPQYVYDPAKLEENWAFIQNVRLLVKTYGPRSVLIDLINEAPPSDFTPPEQGPGLRWYLAELYTRYVTAYGNDDVLVSVIAKGDPSRLENLLAILEGTGQPLPRWFEIHPSYDATAALQDLRAADATLAARGLAQPFILGEEAYDDTPVAEAIAHFMHASQRPINEVIEWPLTADLRCKDFSVSPPYRADAYITVLTGRPKPPPTPDPLPLPPVPTLFASVGPGRTISLKNAAGESVNQLTSGPYRLVVRDRSLQDNFHLSGPDIDRRTGLRFRGTAVWRIEIGSAVTYGSRYTYSSDRHVARLHFTFRIS